jgi:hypothetical protein
MAIDPAHDTAADDVATRRLALRPVARWVTFVDERGRSRPVMRWHEPDVDAEFRAVVSGRA